MTKPKTLDQLQAEKEQAETQRKINALIDSLADFSDSTAAVHLKKRIEELNGQDAALSSRIRELESLTDEGVLAGMEFDLMRQLLTVFHDNIDDMTVTQKRAAIRTVVRKVVWDGKVAHVVLFGSPEDEIDWTTFPVDPEEDENDPEGGGDGSDSPSGVRWGEDSILNASTGIGRKFGSFAAIEGRSCFDQPNRSNRNQIFLITVAGIVLLNDVRHQPQIVFNQLILCLFIPLLDSPKTLLLFLLAQRLRKTTASGHMQCKINHVAQGAQHHCSIHRSSLQNHLIKKLSFQDMPKSLLICLSIT